MPRDEYTRPVSDPLSEAQTQQLYSSLDQYNSDLRRRKRPSIILAALLVLFVASATGIPLSVVLMVKAAEVEKAISLPRDIVFFAGILSLLYICLHIKGARRDYRREGTGPPQQHGHYLHASALLVARLGIVTWVAALVATTVLMARTARFQGLSGRVSVLNLMLCTSAIPPFLIISVTIERDSAPFATVGISKESSLTCRVRDFDDGLNADSSVSRRASVYQQKQSDCGSVLTLPTEDIFKLGAPKSAPKDEKIPEPEPEARNVPEHVVVEVAVVNPSPALAVPSSTPPIPAPKETYHPGGWRAEWNNGMGPSRMSTSSVDAHVSLDLPSSIEPISPVSTAPCMPEPPSPVSTAPYTPEPPSPMSTAPHTPAEPVTVPGPYAGRRARSLGRRSNLSTVRYAAAPEIAVRQPIRVVRNPAYVDAVRKSEAVADGVKRTGAVVDGVKKPEPVARAEELRRNPSNFSRPIRGA